MEYRMRESFINRPGWLFIIALLAALPLAAQTASELNFMTGLNDARAYPNMLPDYLRRKANAQLQERRRKVAAMVSLQDLEARRKYIRERMLASIGGLPAERTPLNARLTGTLERDGYRIEKIIFESRPRLFVTANLYLPKSGSPPWPAVLFPLGHEAGGKAHSAWQQVLGSFARKGFVALAWEPVGQGERVQIYDEDLEESKVVRSTTEHSMQGIQCLLLGDTLARHTIWDGLRALDYLVSRKEVDPSRVGVTGNSGGGTHTAYLAALDDRLQVAAPSCYITSWSRLLETIGPQDAEQCMPPSLADGLDQADFILAFAPKPYLMLSAIRDFFSIAGARESFEEAKGVYARVGATAKMHMVEADDGHGYSKPRRLAAYDWFGRWLKGAGDSAPEPDIVVATPEDLQCTATGQVATSLGGETVFSLNQQRLKKVRRTAIFNSAEQLARFVAFERRAAPLSVRAYGALRKEGYRIEKLVYEPEAGIAVPALLYLPDGAPARRPAAIYVHGQGKAAAREDAESLVKSGAIVLSVDVRGTGETRPAGERYGADWARSFGDFDSTMTALLTGKPLVAMRAEDITAGAGLLAGRGEVDPERIAAIGRDGGAVPVLYAAALDSRIRRVALEGVLGTYESVLQQRVHRQVFEHIVKGALRHYDLPDLARWLAPRPVRIVDAVSPMGRLLPVEEIRKRYADAGAHVRIARRQPADTAATLYRDLLGNP